MSQLLTARPQTLAELTASGWTSKSVKSEIRTNFLRMLAADESLFPGIIGYEDTVIPEINIAIIAGHDMLFLGEKGQAKSRLMRGLIRFLDEFVPYLAKTGPGSRPLVPQRLRPSPRHGPPAGDQRFSRRESYR